MFSWSSAKPKPPLPQILSSKSSKEIAKIVTDANLTDDALVKISRQLDFWFAEDLPDDELIALAERLVKSTKVSSNLEGFTCPKVRFGKTEIMIPIITTGGMRIQWTWLPDLKPLTYVMPSFDTILKSDSQEKLKVVIRRCMKMGLNHFETARFYGTSEHQFAVALHELMEAGEFKREDFIFQTKIPAMPKKDFLARWDESWGHIGDRLGYIDLFSFHCSSMDQTYEMIFAEGDENLMEIAKTWKKEGKIKNIGFSTHGDAACISKHIESKQFDYINLHSHYFGSYHAEGTPNPYGGHGNAENVKRALELDMGVFQISPIDKGGYLQKPTATVARTIGPKLSPIAFSLLDDFKNGFHTSSVGFGRPTDMDESIDTASLVNDDETKKEFEGAQKRLEALAKEKLGEEWYEKGLLDIPSFCDEDTQGIAIGHILWCHNVITAFGMYEFAKQRYKSLENIRKSTKQKETFEETLKGMPSTNPGFSYDPNVDLTKALSKHYNPKLALKKIVEAHSWLNKDVKFTEEELKERGWNAAYDLQTWELFPHSDPSTSGVALQVLSRGRYGISSSPEKDEEWLNIVKTTRAAYKSALSL